jgi:hypothetical protein
MLDELMSQYVDVDNKDFWDDSVSIDSKGAGNNPVYTNNNILSLLGLQALFGRILSIVPVYEYQI